MDPLLVFLLLPLVSAGGPITAEENEKLQAKCGKFAVPPPQPQYRSMNTPNASREEAPWTVAIRRSNDGIESSRGWCTGSFISSRHVITAAHCLIGSRDHCAESKPYSIHASLLILTTTQCIGEGTVSCDSTLESKYLRVQSAYVSRNYMKCGDFTEQKLGDVAVLELEKDVTFTDKVGPICLGESTSVGALAVGDHLTLFGYGNAVDSPRAKGGSILRKLSTKVFPYEECVTYTQERGLTPVYIDTICSRHPKEFACSGDSGGGEVIVRNDRAYLVGTLNGGVPCNLDLHPEEIMDYSSAILMHYRWIAAVSGVNPGYPITPKEKALLAQEYWEYGRDD